jgi:hypothetical protein
MEQISVVNSTNTFSNQNYDSKDASLLNGFDLNREFGAEQDVIAISCIFGYKPVTRPNVRFKNYSVQTTTEDSSL